MRPLLRELLPHAPQIGLYVTPAIPEDKLRNAIQDFATAVAPDDVLALYDATLLRNGKDGAVFTADRIVFQNNDLEPAHEVRYADVVGVELRGKLLGGKRVVLNVNRGRATFELAIDFSGRPKASDYVARFLREAMLRGDEGKDVSRTDVERVRKALDALHAEGALSDSDLRAMLRAIGASKSGPGTRS